MRRGLLIAILQFTVLAVPFLPLSPARAADTIVKIDNFTFNPSRVKVTVGTAVTWQNDDDIPHTVASSTKLFKSKALDTDDTFAFRFTAPGVYQYFCSLHPHM